MYLTNDFYVCDVLSILAPIIERLNIYNSYQAKKTIFIPNSAFVASAAYQATLILRIGIQRTLRFG